MLMSTYVCVCVYVYCYVCACALMLYTGGLMPMSSHVQCNRTVLITCDDIVQVSHIYRIIKRLFDRAALNAECVIISLIYIDRFLFVRSAHLTPRNWLPLIVAAL